MSTPVMAALIGAAGAILAAAVTAAADFDGHPGVPSIRDPIPASASPSKKPTVFPTARPSSGPRKLYKEETYNHLGTKVFSDPTGGAVTHGPVSIPFGTQVLVKCWSPNESGMKSINVFYLVETSPWKGEYAPANTFLNADTSGARDPDVPECGAT
jgi:hypothetical protein